MKNVVAIVGNTGVGKSDFAVELAQAFNGEVINADALQMYEGLPVVTNKHPMEERKGVPHHLMGKLPWSCDNYTVQNFEKDGLAAIEQIHERNKLPILVGGTHYYIQSLLAEQSTIAITGELTAEQQAVLDEPEKVEAILQEVDPVICAKFHPNDVRRLRRALEVYFLSGRKASDIYREQEAKLRFRVLIFWIQCQRDVLTERLDNRVKTMLDTGLMEEMKDMYKYWQSYDTENKPSFGIWQVLGFRQFLPYLEGQSSLEPCIEDLQSQTRQYAKRQTKWIRNKLFPYFKDLPGATLATLDSSDLAEWSTRVKDRGLGLTREWLDQKTSYSLDLIEIDADTDRRQQAFDEQQWVRRRCDSCSLLRDQDVWVLGDDAWASHLKSKGHRASTRKRID